LSPARQLARRVGIDTSQVYRARKVGLTVWAADRWACACGLHPATVWGTDWFNGQNVEVLNDQPVPCRAALPAGDDLALGDRARLSRRGRRVRTAPKPRPPALTEWVRCAICGKRSRQPLDKREAWLDRHVQRAHTQLVLEFDGQP